MTSLVSVCMITYNHESYIGQAIEGVLNQKTTFPIELIIGEDCSTDSTRAICLEYQKKFPEQIRLQLPDTNKGMMRNFIENMQAAKGRYIALCEGDDYWIDPYKLQKQVDFLDSNDGFVACFHNARVTNQHNHVRLFNALDENEYPVKDDIISRKWFIATASLMFRNNQLVFPEWMYQVVNGDYALELLLASKGDFYYMHDVMSVYRQHDASVSRELNRKKVYLYSKLIEIYQHVFELFPQQYAAIISSKIAELELEIKKEKQLIDYPFIQYFNWKFYKRRIFTILRLQRV